MSLDPGSKVTRGQELLRLPRPHAAPGAGAERGTQACSRGPLQHDHGGSVI